MNDPLAKFRNIGTPTPASTDTTSQTDGESLPAYQAFEAKDRVKRLQIRQVMAATHSPAYAYLLDVSYDGFHGTELVLTYSFMMVKIKGQNLQTLIFAIEKHECAFIQDFDARFFAPPEQDAAIIDDIEVVTRER